MYHSVLTKPSALSKTNWLIVKSIKYDGKILTDDAGPKYPHDGKIFRPVR